MIFPYRKLSITRGASLALEIKFPTHAILAFPSLFSTFPVGMFFFSSFPKKLLITGLTSFDILRAICVNPYLSTFDAGYLFRATSP